MWEAIGGALKTFFEKHLIPTIISGVTAIAAFLWIPNDFWMIGKIGVKLFLLLIAGITFLLIKLLCAVFEWIKTGCNKRYYKEKNKKSQEKEAEEEIEKYLSFVDSLPPEERDLLLQFIQNENKPIVKRGLWSKGFNSIYNTNAIISIENYDGSKQYKLDERFYKALRTIYDLRGSISHF